MEGVRHRRSRSTAAVTLASLLFLYLPLGVVLLFSFNSTAALSLPFEGFSTRWYEQIVSEPEVRAAVLRSLGIAATTAVVTVVLGTMAAYGLTRTTSRLRAPLTAVFFLPITVPGLFLGLALVSFFTKTETPLGLGTVLIAHCVFAFPFFLLLARVVFGRLDPALEEVAADLGASSMTIFRRVTLPQVWPVLVAGGALAFMISFDEFIITYFVAGSSETLPLYIFAQLRRTVDPTINAISTLLLAASLALSALALALSTRAARKQRVALQAEGTER